MLGAVWERMLDFVYPPVCCACGVLLPNSLPLCSACAQQTRVARPPICSICALPLPASAGTSLRCARCTRRPPAFARVRAAFLYHPEQANPLGHALSRFKYGRLASLAQPLGLLLQHTIEVSAAGYDLLVPVPLHPQRLRWRGFNQALLLARVAYPRAPLAPFTLCRLRPTPPQAELTRKQRLQNVRRAFTVPRRYRATVAGKRVLLLDDVMTTGATLHHCSAALRRAGATSVDAVVLARAVLG